MDNIKIIKTCPFGNTCRELKNNAIHQCELFLEMEGAHPQTGEIIKESKCSFVWNTLLQVEANNKLIGVQAATESFRNDMTQQNAATAQLMLVTANKQLLTRD